MNAIHWVDYLIIIASLIFSVLIGVYFAKRQKNTDNFFKASGSLPSWAIGMSILATLLSCVTFLAYPGEGYSSNWIRLVQGLMVPIVLLAIVGFIVPLFRNIIKLSAFEYFEQRFGLFPRMYSSLSFILTHFSKMGTVLYLVAMALSPMLGVEIITIVWIIGIIVIVVTAIGGIEAVVWLDVIQGFLLILGGLIALGILLFSVDGGPVAIWQVAQEGGRIGFGPFDIEFVNLTFIVMALNGVFYAIQKYGTDQTIVQRYLTARSDKAAIKASLMGILLSVPVWAIFMFIGTALYGYYQLSGDVLPQGIAADAVFPHFIMTKLPVGIVGLILSALIAAAISSLDSDLNCLSAVLLEDFHLKMFPSTSQKQQLFLGKLFILIAGIGSVLVALIYVNAGGKGVLGIVFTLYSIFSGGIAGMFLLGIFSRKANNQGLIFGIGACVIFTGYALLTSTPIGLGDSKDILIDLGKYNYTHHSYMIGVYSHIILFVVGYVASLFFKGKDIAENLTYYGWKKLKKNNVN